jgi:H+/Cl- antiporter ClcA
MYYSGMQIAKINTPTLSRYMPPQPHVVSAVRQELTDWQIWFARFVLLVFAALAGLTVVFFTWLAETALEQFFVFQKAYWWGPLLWIPLSTAAIVALTRRWAPGAAGSGIPQVLAALEPNLPRTARSLFVSIPLAVYKIALTTWGLLAGLSLGREGPSVQIAAGVMHEARHWIPERSGIRANSLIMAGGAAGIAAAFNTPLGGIMFAIEELSKKTDQRNYGYIVLAIVIGGLMGVSVYGNANYFGVIRIENFSTSLILPALTVALCCGVAGGLFSRLLIVSLSGNSTDYLSTFRKKSPIIFAAGCGVAVAIIGVVTHGETFGSGYEHNRAMLENTDNTSAIYAVLKYISTWITTWSGVPAGVFAPSLAIGGALGNDIAQLTSYINPPTLIALGMAGFLAAVTQAPLTAFIIVMEMIDGHGLVLSLMATAILSSGVSKLLSAPLYASLADLQLQRAALMPPRTL